MDRPNNRLPPTGFFSEVFGDFKSNSGTLPILFVIIAWWLLSRPYMGIVHDGVIYCVQALRHLYPDRYAQDVFFQYGSQDDFTLFSSMHALLIGLLGLDRSFLILTLLGAFVWLGALLCLLKRWLKPIPLVLTAILVLSWDPYYGGLNAFSYGERFASPRLFAEGLVLLSVSFWLEKRKLLSWIALGVASSFHPIMALAGLGVLSWSVLSTRTQRPVLIWAVLIFLGLLLAKTLTVMGFSPLLDPHWRLLVEERTPFLFPHLWNATDWLRVALDASLLFLALRYLESEDGKLAAWTLPVMGLGIAFSLAGTVMESQLLVAAQPYRVQWLAHLLAIALIVPLCTRLWLKGSIFHRYLAAAIICALLFPINLGGIVLPVMYGVGLWIFRGKQDDTQEFRLGWILLPAAVMAVISWLYYAEWYSIYNWNHLGGRSAWLFILMQPPFAVGLFFSANILLKKYGHEAFGLWAYALCLLAVALPNWHNCNAVRIFEGTDRDSVLQRLEALIPEKAVVYWESTGHVTAENRSSMILGYPLTWLWLNRSHYASRDQGVGIVFYKSTAIELERRIKHLAQWGFRDGIDAQGGMSNKASQVLAFPERLKGLCSDPVLDYVITDSLLHSARLNFNDPLTGRKFAVYACESFRTAGSE